MTKNPAETPGFLLKQSDAGTRPPSLLNDQAAAFSAAPISTLAIVFKICEEIW